MTRRGALWLASIGIPVLALVAVALIWGWDLLIPLVAARASAALGRPVTIAHLHIRPGRILRIVADDVVVGNPPNWQGEPLATIDHLTIDADAWNYIRTRQIVVPLVIVDHPLVIATQTAAGDANYLLQVAGGSDSGGSTTRVDELRIAGGHAQVRLAKLQADFQVEIATGDASDHAQLRVEAHGTYAAQPISGQLIGGALLSLGDKTKPWPVDLKLRNGPTTVALDGTLLDPLKLQGASLKLLFAGPDMSLLDKLTGLPIPKTPNYQVAGQLDFADGRVQFRNFKGRVGNSDLNGTIDADPAKQPPEVTADLVSHSVDLADLGGFIGAEPGRVTTTGQTPAQRAEVAKAETSSKLLPDTPVNVPKLQWANIHLRYTGQHIQGRSMPLDNLQVVLDIVNGQVAVHPISFAVGTGRISGNVVLTPQDRATHARADVDFQRVDVARLMAATHLFEGAGAISGSGRIDTTGNSMAQFLGNGNGGLRLAMVGGDLSALLVDLSGLQFGNALLSALGLPNRTPAECFITELALQRGVVSIQALTLDTGEGIVNGQGNIDLANEKLDLQLRTQAKHFTIGSLPAPINITGSLRHPSIAPGVELLARGGVAAGLAVVFPPLALLPTIQLGTGDDHRCDNLLAQAKQQPGGQALPKPTGR